MVTNILGRTFSNLFEKLNCQEETKAYITSIFISFKDNKQDLSKNNLTLMFLEANHNREFSKFQSLADWLFFCASLNEASLKFASKSYYYDMAQISYWNCFKLINKKWKLFEELSDNFQPLVTEVKELATTLDQSKEKLIIKIT